MAVVVLLALIVPRHLLPRRIVSGSIRRRRSRFGIREDRDLEHAVALGLGLAGRAGTKLDALGFQSLLSELIGNALETRRGGLVAGGWPRLADAHARLRM